MDDFPAIAEAATMVGALLAALPCLGAQANAGRVLTLLQGPKRGLAHHPRGRCVWVVQGERPKVCVQHPREASQAHPCTSHGAV